MAALTQFAVLVALTAGLGYWFWVLMRQPLAGRALTWLWCGLAGLCLGILALQALVYLDWPVRKTAPWLLLLACLGLGRLLVRLWRMNPGPTKRRWRETACILGAGLAAGLGHSTSLIGIGSDRMLGLAQVDQVNYVITSQFLADEKFSTEVRDVGLHPWIWRAIDMKVERITQCVVLATVAVLAHSDAQRAWGATAVYFTFLLALALAGMWRVAGSLSPGKAACLGLAGALLPVVSYVYLVGFFSQLLTLFIFPALIAVCRPGALPRWVAFVISIVLLGFLADTYNEYWPVAGSMAVGAILWWPGRTLTRIALAAGVMLGSLFLTSAYFLTITVRLFRVSGSVTNDPTMLVGFIPDGMNWLGWGHNFIVGGATWARLAGVLVAVAVPLGILLQPAHRRRHWCSVLAGPVLLLAYLFLQARLPAYIIFKFLATFSPICIGCAAVGIARAFGRVGPRVRRVTVALLFLGGAATASSALVSHFRLVDETRHLNKDRLERLWAARARAEANPHGVFLIENGSGYIGGWLAYFGRAADVYYDLPAMVDLRVASESVAFRKIPPQVKLEWLDLDHQGPVLNHEPSLTLSLRGARSSFEVRHRPVHALGADAELVLTRAEGFAPEEKAFMLEGGFTPLPDVGPCLVSLREGPALLWSMKVVKPTPLSVRFRARPGQNVLTLHVDPLTGSPADHDLLILQALSIEQVR